MTIDEVEICTEIARELGVSLKDVTTLTSNYKESIAESIRNFKKSGQEDKDFKILMPRFCTFKRKFFKNENSGNN